MSNRIFVSKSYICYGKAQFRRLFLIFCRINSKESLNLQGGGGEGLGSGPFPFSSFQDVSQTKTFLLCFWGLLDSQDLPFLQML